MGRKKKKDSITNFVKCTHDRPVNVLKLGKCRIWAGSAREMENNMQNLKPKLLISVGGHTTYETAMDGCKPWPPFLKMVGKDLLPGLKGSPQMAADEPHKPDAALIIDWPDMGAPTIEEAPAEFWKTLVADLQKVDGDVFIFCFGGHGRTGTAITALLHFSGALKEEEDILAWLRENYCEKAVESEKQIAYLKELGVTTQEGPAKEFTSSYSSATSYVAGDGTVYVDGKWMTLDELNRKNGDNKEGDCTLCCMKSAKWNSYDLVWLCAKCEKKPQLQLEKEIDAALEKEHEEKIQGHSRIHSHSDGDWANWNHMM